MNQDRHFETLLIHGGQSPDPTTGAVMPPISLASTYAQTSPGQHQGYAYGRGQNPTRWALERNIAKLEGSTLSESEDITCGGFAFTTGLASITTMMDMLEPGDHILAMDDLYGGTHRLMTRVREQSQGIKVSYVDLTDLNRLEDAITDRTKMIWVETPTNPLLKVVDLSAIGAIGRERGILTICDNTFASPALQRPLLHGFDVVMHSATKYLGGHSDLLAGLLVTSRADVAERLRFLQNSLGTILPPFASYLTLRGIKTLSVRMRQHCESASRLARWLEDHDKVERVFYPCLDSHPQHRIAVKQMQFNGQPAGGGMITIFLRGGLPQAQRFLETVEIFTLAESLGGVESLIEHPAIMTHSSLPPDQREALGISDTLIRISVGIENADDLQADLDRALAAC